MRMVVTGYNQIMEGTLIRTDSEYSGLTSPWSVDRLGTIHSTLKTVGHHQWVSQPNANDASSKVVKSTFYYTKLATVPHCYSPLLSTSWMDSESIVYSEWVYFDCWLHVIPKYMVSIPIVNSFPLSSCQHLTRLYNCGSEYRKPPLDHNVKYYDCAWCI